MRKILEEQRYTQEQQAKLQKEMDAASMGEQMAAPPPPPGQSGAAGGQAGAGPSSGPLCAAAAGNQANAPIGPNQSITPQDLTAAAQQKAQELMQMSDGQRQGEMQRLKASNPTLHMATKQVIDDIRSQAQQQGGEQVLAQTYGKQASFGSRIARVAAKTDRIRSFSPAV